MHILRFLYLNLYCFASDVFVNWDRPVITDRDISMGVGTTGNLRLYLLSLSLFVLGTLLEIVLDFKENVTTSTHLLQLYIKNINYGMFACRCRCEDSASLITMSDVRDSASELRWHKWSTPSFITVN